MEERLTGYYPQDGSTTSRVSLVEMSAPVHSQEDDQNETEKIASSVRLQ